MGQAIWEENDIADKSNGNDEEYEISKTEHFLDNKGDECTQGYLVARTERKNKRSKTKKKRNKRKQIWTPEISTRATAGCKEFNIPDQGTNTRNYTEVDLAISGRYIIYFQVRNSVLY